MATQTDDFTNQPGTTGKLSLDIPASGMFEGPEDSDWFAVDLQAGTRYVFYVQSPRSSDYWVSESFMLTLHDAGGVPVVDTITGAGGAMPAIDFTAPASGKYYLAAGEKYSSIPLGAYTVLAVRHPGSDDFSADTATTGRLAANGTVSGVFNLAGDRDWIKFHAVPTSHYSFSTESGVYPATARLFDASGKLAQQYTYSFDVATEGDYFLEVMGLKTGAYTMALKEWKDDFPDTDLGAGVVAPGGSAVSAAIDYQTDEDRFQVRLEAGKYYSIAVGSQGASQYAPMPAEIVGPSGQQVGSIHLMTGADGTTLLARESGTYYINAHLPMMTIDIKEPVRYSVKVSAAVVDDIGDTPATAATAQVGVTARGVLQIGEDVDVFKVALQAGVTYAFAAQGAGTAKQLAFEVSGVDGKVVGQADMWSADYYTVTPAAGGDYYVKVRAGAYGAAANYAYTLNVTRPADDAGGGMAGAVSLPTGATLTGTLEAGGGDRDWYAVNLTAGTTYWFSAKAVSIATWNAGQLRLLDAAGAELALAKSTDTFGFADTLPFVPSASGAYFLEVSSPRRATGTYSVSASIGERDDAGDTLQTAVALTPGVPANGKLEVGTDKDVYKIAGAPGMTYALMVERTGDYAPSVAFVDGSGTAIPSSTLHAYGAGPNALLVSAPADGNIYAVLSQSSSDRSVGYKLSAVAYAVDDFRADKDTAGLLAPGLSVQGALTHPGDSDWLRTPLEAGKTYAFQLLGAASGGGTLVSGRDFPLSVVGDGYTWTGVTASAIKNAVEARMLFTPAKTGDYYVRIGTDDRFYLDDAPLGTYTVRALQTSGDTAGPVIVAQSHPQNGTGVDLTATRVELRFNEPVSIDPTAIAIRDSQGKKLPWLWSSPAMPPYVNDNVLVLKVQDLLKPGSYTVELPHGAIYDLAGNQYTGPETLRFTTVLPVAAGTPVADLLAGGDGRNGIAIDGGAGVDTVMYTGGPYRTVVRTGAETKVYADGSGAVDVLTGVERVQIGSTMYAVDIDGNGGQAYRLYRAAFDRHPDSVGLGYWIGQLDKGTALRDMARSFVASAEFKSLYGAAPGDDAFLTLLYNNVLHRPPETAGYAYWTDALHNGIAREDVLVAFSESAENQAAVLDVIGKGFTYSPYTGP